MTRRTEQMQFEFFEAAKPVTDWLKKYGDPYTTAVITREEARIDATVFGIGTKLLEEEMGKHGTKEQ